MTLIDGKQLAIDIQNEIKLEVEQHVLSGEKRPHLAAVLVGDDPASAVYIRNKVRACDRVGFESSLIKLPEETTEQELLLKIAKLNDNDAIDGYIVQLPTPSHIDDQKVTLAIRPSKDVDGFHPVNIGRMSVGLPCYLPATPYGIITMMERYKIQTEGKKCAILGRSHIVGSPMSILMSRKAYPGNATVTLVHSRSQDVDKILLESDIIIAAIGIPEYVKSHQVKTGAVIIDVGINRVDAPETKKGYKLVGDVDFENLKDKCSFITPVPGGVGPMTVTSLLLNTLEASKGNIYG